MGYRGVIACAIMVLAPLLTFSGCLRSTVSPDGPVSTGTWAGPEAVVTITAKAAHVEFACASGDIPQPLTVDAAGAFSLDGVFVKEVGPARVEQPARYAGRVDGQTMTLTVTLLNSNETMGAYTLTYNAESHFVKCV